MCNKKRGAFKERIYRNLADSQRLGVRVIAAIAGEKMPV
jgi:hypothetical protein